MSLCALSVEGSLSAHCPFGMGYWDIVSTDAMHTGSKNRRDEYVLVGANL